MTSYRKIMLTIALMLAAMMQTIDTTIANVALPHIQGSLAASQDQINWMLTAYITAAAITTMLTGWLSGKISRHHLFLISIAGFSSASVLCGTSSSISEMVIFRILQGCSGACLIPLSQSVLLDINPKEQHGYAMAIWGMGVMLGPIIGPSLGGYITEHFSWRWVFYINLPIGMIAFLGIWWFGYKPEKVVRPFDTMGFILFTIFITSMQLMLDMGNQQDWFEAFEINTYLVLALSSMWLFIVHLHYHATPFITLTLFADKNFKLGLILIFFVGIILLSTMALLPPFLQHTLNYPVVTVGMIMMPRGIGTMIAMIFVGKFMAKKLDPRILVMFGLALIAWTLWHATTYSFGVSEYSIATSGLLQGIGIGMVFVPLSTISFATLKPYERLEATSLFNLVRGIGSSFGISIVTTILTCSNQINHEIIGKNINIFNIQALSKLMPGADYAQVGLWLNNQVTLQSQFIGYLNCFHFMSFVVIALIPLVLLLSYTNHSELLSE